MPPVSPISNNELNKSGAFLLIDKEKDLSSHDVVLKIRRIFSHQKCGHAGTLDPFATGLLIVALGKATRLLKYFSGLKKTYSGEFEVGKATDTYDITGKVVHQAEKFDLTLNDIRQVLTDFRGSIKQVPPMYSALHYQGKRLYDYARNGVEIQRKPREIYVESFEVYDSEKPFVYAFELTCSAGTYVRALIHDLGLKLGCFAYLKRLKRAFIGPFSWEEAVSVEDLTLNDLLTPGEVVARIMPTVVVGTNEARKIKFGAPFKKLEVNAAGEGPWAFLDEESNLLAVYEKHGELSLRPSVVLANLDSST